MTGSSTSATRLPPASKGRSTDLQALAAGASNRARCVGPEGSGRDGRPGPAGFAVTVARGVPGLVGLLQFAVRDAQVLKHVMAQALERPAFRIPLQPRHDGHPETKDRRADPACRPAKSPADRLRLGPPWGGAEPSGCGSSVRPDAGHGASILPGMSWENARGSI